MRAALLASTAPIVLLVACRAREPQGSSAAPTPAATAAPASDPTTLVGRWLRSDSDYVIEIAGVVRDGSVEAKYFNPRPIHVSRAAWKSTGGQLALLLELTDRNYPGNFYALVYDPGSDALLGTYNHLGLNQQFEVAFSRLPAATP
jgi:hypothetical protein